MNSLMKMGICTIACFLISFGSYAQKKDKVEELKQEFEYLIRTKQWQKAKAKVDRFYNSYPSNPSELERVEKYEVDKYNRIIKEAIYGEERSYRSIKSTRSLRLCEEYLSKYPYGKYREEVKQIMLTEKEDELWEEAKRENTMSSYRSYLRNYRNGKYASEAEKAMGDLDYKAYQKAKSIGTTDSYNYYLSNYPYGIYRDKVRDLLNAEKEDALYERAKNNNYIEYYEDYIDAYPNGKYASTVNGVLQRSYIAMGDKYYKSKSHQTAITYYQKYLTSYSYGLQSSYARKQIEKCQRKIEISNRPDKWYLSYHFDDSLGWFGFSTGTLNQSGVGGYFSMRMNFQDFDKTVIYDYDPTTNYVDGVWDNDLIALNGDVSRGKVLFNTGLTFKLVHPVWLYTGVGLSINTVYNGIDKYYSDGSLYESDWAKNTELSSVNPHLEGGIQADLWGLHLSYGIAYSSFYGMRNTFTVGFTGTRY